MLKNIFLTPGWFFYRLLTQKRRKYRYLARPKDLGPIIRLASIFWVGLALVVWIAVSLASDSNVAPPLVASPAPLESTLPHVSPVPPQAPTTQVSGAPPSDQSANSGAIDTTQGANVGATPPLTGELLGAGPKDQNREGLVAGLPSLIVPDELRLTPDALPPSPEAWLVIVESIPKSARDKAEASLQRQKKKGLDLVLVDTDAYPRLKSGMWALSLGPFDTKAEAEAAASTIKAKVKDFMVRRGL